LPGEPAELDPVRDRLLGEGLRPVGSSG
jgi:hypothetical protein